MRKNSTKVLMACALALVFTACKKEAKETATDPNEISASVLTQIKAAGFNTQGAQKVEGGYLVEGDILLTQDNLASTSFSPEMIYANEEHYRTNSTVNPSSFPTIKVALNNSSAPHQAVFNAALNEAIRRYNALGLRIKFSHVSSGANTTVVAFFQQSNVLGSSGFPTSNGAPFSQVRMNTFWYNTSTSTTNVNYIATIMAHELGHCIGFRHTDYMNRAYSCGGTAVNEGSGGVGAVHISGTPTGPSAGSWMLACVGSNQNRPFTGADVTALNFVY